MLLQSRYDEPFLVSKLLCNHMAIIAFRIFCRLCNVFLQIGILEKDREQTVTVIQLFQIRLLAIHAAYTRKVGIEH